METQKNNREIFAFSSNNSPILWQPDSLRLSKYDECGEAVWHRQISFDKENKCFIKSGFTLLQNGKFGFVTLDKNGNINHSRLTVLNSDGTIAWTRSFQMPNYSLFSYSLMQNAAGELIVYGNGNLIGGGASISYLYKTDINGNQMWVKSYTNGGIWGGAILTSDQGILMRNGLKFTKTDPNGTVQWSTTISDLGNYFFSAPIEMKDGYIFSGTNSGGSLSLSFFKIDFAGNLFPIHKRTINYNSVHRNMVKKNDSTFTCILNASLSRKYPTLVEFNSDLTIVKKNTLHLSQPYLSLTGTGLAFMESGLPIVSGILDSSFNYRPFFGTLNSDYLLGCDTTIGDSMRIQTVTQLTNTVTQQNEPALILTDTTFSEKSLNFASKTLCEDNNFSLWLGNDTVICPKTTLVLNNKTNWEFTEWQWNTGETSSQITVSQPGIYWLTATNSCYGVTITDSIVVSLYNFPMPRDTALTAQICINEYITLDAEIPQGSYLWQDNSALPYYHVTKPGNYFVEVTSDRCKLRFNYTITDCESLHIPNVFTPNGDGTNDLFVIDYRGFQSYNLLIYNRWGQVVFQSEDRNFHWNGQFKNKQISEGVYFFVLTIGDKNHKGNVSVFR